MILAFFRNTFRII